MSALEISCAKPGCVWSGTPADAAAHPCPTVADDDAAPPDPFEGLEAIADSRPTGEIDETSDPRTKAELEAWLATFGQYDEAGIPLDEKTAELDARLSTLGDAVDEAIAAAGHDAAHVAELPEGDEADVTTDDSLPLWPGEIAAALETQTAVAEHRWLVVWLPEDGQAELIGRGKTKVDANEVADNVKAAGQLVDGKIDVVKTQDVLDAAERLRENVQEPDKTVETVVEPPLEEDEPADAPIPATKEGEQGALLDREKYEREDLAIAKIDGSQIDRIALAFSGSVMLDRSDPKDVKLYNRIKQGDGELELRVAGRWGGTAAKPHTNREGDLDVVVGTKTLRVETVWILDPEDL